MKKLILASILLLFSTQSLFTDTVYVLDVSKVLNVSKAGKEAQEFLKKRIETDNKKFQSLEKKLLDKEKNIISKKNVLSNDEYKKQIESLRKEVSKLQNDKKNSLNYIAKTRARARSDLIKALNPILQEYMKSNNIRTVIDKKNVILADTKLEITSPIISELNKKLKSLNLK
tara:strand:- start:577 stop:1092 length:516 start_codon:yes stop_codon:yes gene_type:complete